MRLDPAGRKHRRGIYLLPNLLTTAALFAGFYGIVAGMGGRFEAAAVAIYVAMVLDGIDGRIARITNTQSAFGAEYDSLSDMVSFGLAPALILYAWSLVWIGKLGWLAAFVFAATAALRLARFNTQVASTDKRYFQGLPSPAAAALLMGLVWISDDHGIRGQDAVPMALAAALGAGLLMVSKIRFHSFKELDVRGRVPFAAILAVVLIFVAVSSDPPLVLFLGFLLYALSGPVLTLVHVRRRRAARRGAEAAREERTDSE